MRLYRQLAQIQRCLRLLVGIHVPPSSRFSRLQEEQNLRLWELSWVAAGVEVVMGNPGKANLYTEDLFYPFCPAGTGVNTTFTESAVLLPSKSSQALFSKSYSLHLRAVSKYQLQENF